MQSATQRRRPYIFSAWLQAHLNHEKMQLDDAVFKRENSDHC